MCERMCIVYACMCTHNICMTHAWIDVCQLTAACLCIPITANMYCADEEEKELPHPFLLPKYPMDVEIALQQGKLLATTYQKFISGTARAILSYKRHPTPDERNRVASEIVGKYPFLKSPGNKPEVCMECSWKAMLSVMKAFAYRNTWITIGM